MNTYSDIFDKKSALLEEKLFDREALGDISSVCGRFAAFVSVSDINERAYVFRSAANSPEEAWKNACAAAREFIGAEDLNPAWVKADITTKVERASLFDTLSALHKGYAKFFRRGISFDETLDRAVIEAELNVCGLIDYKKGTISLKKLNKFLDENDLETLEALPESIPVFTCKSAFCDEKNAVYELYSDDKNCGRRVLEKFDKETAFRVITTSADYLAMQIGLDGKFDYGVYPAAARRIGGYNILRHASSVWSLLCSYRLTGDNFIKEQAESAIGFLIRNMKYKYPSNFENNVLYVFEETKNEVKIGGNAIAIIVLTEYMDVFQSDKYLKIVKELGNGILELFDERDGSFFHVLKFPSLAPRDRFRTIYYDGEAVFALSRLYGITKDRRFLEAAQSAADRFIKKKYEQYADHWVAYSINELTKHIPLEKYLNFGVRNARANLEKIKNQPTTYHTYLELLCVSFELVERIKRDKLRCSESESFDAKQLADVIFHRADHMLNGYCYPEYAMYFPNPESTLGAFFIRHDDYRIRIDDVQHFCSAYYALYRNYEALDEFRK